MSKRAFQVGDQVTVIGSPHIRCSPGVRDEIGTKKLLKSMIGNVYTVRGFEECGHIELRPKRLTYVWIEREFLKLRARKREKP